jgi:hypothetical protein
LSGAAGAKNCVIDSETQCSLILCVILVGTPPKRRVGNAANEHIRAVGWG